MLRKFKIILISSGLYNIIFSFPLAIPGLSAGYLNNLGEMNSKMNLGGKPVIVPQDPLALFLINAAGLCLILIGCIVIYASQNPVQRSAIIWLNVAGRLSFTLVLTYYLLFQDLPQIAVLFGVLDLIICILFVYFLTTAEFKSMKT